MVTDAAVEAALVAIAEETNLPYGATIRDFSDEDIAAGALREADAECERLNREFARRVLEAAAEPHRG